MSAATPTATVQLTLDKSTVFSDKARVQGPHAITVGANSIVHPRAQLYATRAPISIGQNCVIEENALIEATIEGKEVQLGNWNLVACGAQVFSSIGHANLIRAHAVISTTATLGRGNEVSSACRVDGELADGSFVSNLKPSGQWKRTGLKEKERKHMETIQSTLDVFTPIMTPKASSADASKAPASAGSS